MHGQERIVSIQMLRFLLLISMFCLLASGCRELGADKLSALHLDHVPTASDWHRALPRTVMVKGGREHKIVNYPDIDSDTVHVTTASCHHGASLPDPIPVDMRAFYTDSDIYLRLSWPDATRDDSIMRWRFDGKVWHDEQTLEDGFGLMWDAERKFPGFTCSYVCHIDDFGVSGDSFHARNKMRLAVKDAWTDLWHWKAERTGRLGFADDRTVDLEGMHGDLPGEIFRENSVAASHTDSDVLPFSEQDQPLVDADGLPPEERFHAAGSTAPGYLTEMPKGSRADIAASMNWENGRWTVILHRALKTSDPRDVVFVPGDTKGIPFGLAVMDHTLNEHYASTTQESLVLLAN